MDPPVNSSNPPPPPVAGTTPEPHRRRGGGGGQKRKSSTPSSSSAGPSKRLIKERNALNIGSSPLHNGPVTRARQTPSKIAAAATPSPPAAAASYLAADGGRTGPTPIEEEQVLADEPIFDAGFDAVRSRGRGVHVVPVPAGWFSWKDIHPIEKHTLASFFNGKVESRTPEIYMEIRNYIMKKFHADPQTQLELKDLAEIAAGDSEARREVMEFLDHWGLINFHPFPPSSSDLGLGNSHSEEDKATASLIKKLYEFESVQSCPRIVPKKVEVSASAEVPNFLPVSTIAEDLIGSVGPSVEYHCNSCSADCSRKRYHCQKQADFDLCTDCYNDGKFGSGMTAADFILMEPAEVPGVSGGSWTDQETLLLLEALELFGENWNEIAEHVATKSKAQCILHFLQMPIEDPFLDGNDDAGEKTKEEMDPSSASKETDAPDVSETKLAANADGTDQLNSSPTDVPTKRDASELELSCENGAGFAIDALKAAFQAIGLAPEQGLPSFAEAGNPVMALAAFLARLVESDAATTSHRSSLKALSEESPGLQLATRHCFILEDPPNDMKDPPATESADTDMGDGEAPKTEDQMPTLNGSDELKASNGSDELKASNGSDESKPSNGTDGSRPSNDSDGSKPSNGSDKSKPSNGSDESKPSNGSDESKPSNGSDESKPSNGSDESKPSDGSDELMPPNDTDQLKPSNGSDELKPSNGSDELKPSDASDEPKPSNGSDKPEDSTEKNEESAVPIQHEISQPVVLQDCLEKPLSKESSDSDSPLEAAPSSSKEPDVPTLQGEQIGPIAVKDKDESVSSTVVSSNNSKESGDKAFQGEVAPNYVKETSASEVIGEDKQGSLKESGKLASVEAISDTSMAMDTKPISAPSEEQEYHLKGGTDSTLHSTEIRDGDDKKESPSNSEKNETPTETNNDRKRRKLKHAAATIFSAAAVKAKLLANEEEDQIRQLVSLVIEKQLHKLETKLALFTEIESVIMRVREQTERARQRLIHERAQIIAARFGLPAPPARGNQMLLPTGKFPMGYATTGSKPPPTMPHMRRP